MSLILSQMTVEHLNRRVINCIKSANFNLANRLDKHDSIPADLLSDLESDLRGALAAIKELDLRDRDRRLRAEGK